jgi:hypothetical protein
MTSVSVDGAPPVRPGWSAGRSAGGRAVTLAPMFALVGLAALVQIHLGTTTDVSWLITLAERMLDGQRPYVDFLEANPPASILIYLAPVALARLVGVAPEFMVAAFGFFAALVSMALCAAILGEIKLREAVGGAGLGVAGFALLLLPTFTFDQRDHIALIAGLPLLALIGARVEGARIGRGLAMLAGLGGAVMLAIRPHYALCLGLAGVELPWRRRLRDIAAFAEAPALVVGVAAYLALIAFQFPDFAARILPIAAAVYVPVRQPLARMALDPGFVAWLGLAAALGAQGFAALRAPLVRVAALASLGALASFFIQAKGWPYHIYPALALIVIALGLALRARLGEPRALAIACACAGLTLVASAFDGPWPWRVLLVVAAASAALVVGRLGGGEPLRARRDMLGLLAGALAIGLALAWLGRGTGAQPRLEAAIRTLGPHPTLAAITGDIAIGHPLTRRLGARWTQRVCSLWITAGADRLLARGDIDAASARRLEDYRRADLGALAEDVDRGRPDAILVNALTPPLAARSLADARVAAALAPYVIYATVDDGDGPTTILVRRDRSDPPAQ